MSDLEVLVGTEVSAPDSHGGENRIKAARFPARKTLEEFDFTFQRSVKKQVIEHLGQFGLPPRQAERDPSRTAWHRQDKPEHRSRRPRLLGRPAGSVRDRDSMARPAC
jgi:hypothetical protein